MLAQGALPPVLAALPAGCCLLLSRPERAWEGSSALSSESWRPPRWRGPGCLLGAAGASSQTHQGSGPGALPPGLCSRDCAALVLRAQLGSRTVCSTYTEPARVWTLGPRWRGPRRVEKAPASLHPVAAGCMSLGPGKRGFHPGGSRGVCQVAPWGSLQGGWVEGVGPWLWD